MNLSTMENSISTKSSLKKKSDRLLSISQTVVDPYIFFLNSGIRPFWPSIGATVMFSKN